MKCEKKKNMNLFRKVKVGTTIGTTVQYVGS